MNDPVYEPQLTEFRNPERESRDDGSSYILDIKKNSDWRYTDYVPPGTHKNHESIWKFPSCKKMVKHLRICGGSVTYLIGIICDGNPSNMQQLLVAILEEFEKTENKEAYAEWNKLIDLGEKAASRFGDDALLRQYKEGTVKTGVASILAGKRKGSATSAPAPTPETDAGAAMLADLANSGEEV